MAGIYVHIPFCVKRCGYCDFFSSTDRGAMEGVLRGIEQELERERGWLTGRVGTVYFGGGTPSLCAPEWFARILERAGMLWDYIPEEVTVECNPDDMTPEWLDGLAKTGVDRVSIGVQSFVDRDLRLMGRRHDAQAAKNAVREAKKRFDNVTIDLIFGVPGMGIDEWRGSLEAAVELGVEHISAYHLTLEPGTPMGGMQPVGEDVSERQFATLRQVLTDAGYEHYEVSNFALPGRRARHNAAYWRGVPYLGVGPGAHSFDGRARRHFAGTVADYAAGRMEYHVEVLSEKDLRNELIMTHLRTADGLPDSLVPGDFDPRRAAAQGLLVHADGHWRIPPEKFLLSDFVIGGLFL